MKKIALIGEIHPDGINILKNNEYEVVNITDFSDENLLKQLKDIDGIADIRGYGTMGGIDIKVDERPGKAGYSCFKKLFEAGLSLKATGDCLIVAPPFVCEEHHIDEIIEKLRTGITNYFKTK